MPPSRYNVCPVTKSDAGDTKYIFEVDATDGGTTLKYSINGTLVCTHTCSNPPTCSTSSPTGGTPSTSTLMQPVVGTSTLTTAAKSLKLREVQVDLPQ